MKTAADGAQTFFLFDHAVGFPHARFEVVGLFPEAIGVDCEPRTDEVLTVTIELARFGRIRFALIGPDGSELSSEGFSLFIEAKAPGRTENSEDGTELPSFYIGPRHSESLLAFAPLGVTYVVRSSANRLSDWSQYLEVSSPSTSGDTIEVVLEAPDLFQRGRIRLRFTDLEGRPLPGLEFDVRSCAFTSARPSGTFGACLTDDRGLFEADVLFLKQADATPRLLDVWLYETGTSIEVGPGDVGKDGVLDFGECRVDPNPIIARGLVTDEAGVPIPGVELTLRSLERWRRFHHLFDDLVTRSDDRGSFEFRHPQAPHVFGILASLPGHVGSAQFNEEGRTEFSFVMKKTALLELDVKIEGHEGRRCPGLRAVLIHASSGERKVLALDDDGRLTTNVDPGDYRLTLAPWSYAEMEPVDEISFRVEDPSEIIRRTLSVRLEPDTVILNFIDGNPSHSRDREITLRFLSPEPGAPVPEWWYRVEDSMIAAVIPNRPREIEIVKPGYETQRLMLDSAHVDVAFQPISRVMVSGEGLGTRPKDALIEARLVPKEEHDGLRPIEVPIARDGEPNQCKSIAGAQRYRLELRIGKLGKSGMRWRTLRSLIPATSYGSSSYWGDPRSRASFFYLVVPSEVDAASEALSAEIQDE